MTMLLDVFDQRPGTARELSHRLDLPTERITARELLRRRVIADIAAHNAKESAIATANLVEYRSEVERHAARFADWKNVWLVTPGGVERALNGDRGDYGPKEAAKPALPPPPPAANVLDSEAYTREAFHAFERNGFFMIFDGRQVTDLDEVLTVERDSALTFVRLVQLVGG